MFESALSHYIVENPLRKSIVLHFKELITNYKDYLLQQNPVLACTNTRIPIKDILKIDLENFEKIMHLRLPRRNKRPEDIKLASGYTSKCETHDVYPFLQTNLDFNIFKIFFYPWIDKLIFER